MKKNMIKNVLSVAVAASLAVGCIPMTAMAEESTDYEPVTITIGNWPKPDDPDYEYSEEVKEQFMKDYPYITVETDESVYDVNTFLPKAASGQLPDLFHTYFTEADKIINAGYAQDITEAFNNSEFADSCNAALVEQVTRDGKIYGIPMTGYSIGFLCNVNLFEEAGLIDEEGLPLLPTTWDEVAEYASIIKEKTGKAGFAYIDTENQGGWLFSNLAWAFGAELETQVDGKWTATFDSAEAVSALQYLKDLKWKYNVMPDNSIISRNDWITLYGTDQAAMGLAAIDFCNNIVNTTGMSKDDMAMTTVPAGPAGKVSLMGGAIFMMPNGTSPEQQDAIIKWLLYGTLSPRVDDETMEVFENQTKSDAEAGYPVGPYGLSVWSESCERTEKEQEIKDKYNNVDMRLWDSYCQHSSENLKTEPPVNAQELYAALDGVIQEVLTNENADCQELLTTAAENFQKDYLDNAN